MGKAVKSVTKAAGSAISTTVKAVGKIAEGKVSEGVGDLGETWTKASLDMATGGQRNTVDALTGGLTQSAIDASRGNTKDLIRVGAVAGATAVGGPAAAMAANAALSQGSNIGDIAKAGIAVASGGGTNVEWLNSVGNILNNPTVSNLTSGLFNKSPSPAPSAAPVIMTAAAPSAGMSQSTMMMIGGGVLAIVLVLVVAFKGKK